MRNRVAGEARKRGDPVRNVGSPDRAERQQVIKRDAAVGGGHQRRGQRNETEVCMPDDLQYLVMIDVPEHVRQGVDRDRFNTDTYENPNSPDSATGAG